MKNSCPVESYRRVLIIRIIHIIIGCLIAAAIFFYLFPKLEEEMTASTTVGKIEASMFIGYFFMVFMSFLTPNTTKCSRLGGRMFYNTIHAPLLIKLLMTIPTAFVIFVFFPIVFVTYPFETLFAIRNAIEEKKLQRITCDIIAAGQQFQREQKQ